MYPLSIDPKGKLEQKNPKKDKVQRKEKKKSTSYQNGVQISLNMKLKLLKL